MSEITLAAAWSSRIQRPLAVVTQRGECFLSEGTILIDCFAQAIVEFGASAETKLSLGARYIQAAAWLAVGTGRVPKHATRETGKRADFGHESCDGDFLPGAKINRFRLVVKL